jgi:hypothetical protein
MSNKLQNHIRSNYNHLPVHCGFCGHQVLGRDDSAVDPTPCKHTLYIAHSEGFEFIADRVKKQIKDKGFIFEDGEFITSIEHESDADQDLFPYEMPDILEFDDGLNVECVVGAPSGMVVYVGFAPLEGEE